MAPAVITPTPVTNGTKLSEVPFPHDRPMSPTLQTGDGLHVSKFGTRDSPLSPTQSQRPRFGRSTSVAFDGQSSVHDFLKMLKNERFRHMPHDGSSWDKVLKWADNIGGVVLLSHGILNDFMLNSEDATRLICDSCTSILQLGTPNIKVILKVFSVFHKMVFALSVFLRQNHLIKSTTDVRRELAHAYQEFAHFTFHVKEYTTSRSIGTSSVAFATLDTYLNAGTTRYYDHLKTVSVSMWASQKHCSHFNLLRIRGFLTPQDSVVRTIMSNQLYSEFNRAEFTCEWFAPYLRKFIRNGTTADKRVFLITGGACTGKTVLARWIYEKLQESVDDEPYDVITYSVDTNVKYTTNPLSLIKSLLLQLLDRKIGRETLLAQITKAIELSQKGASAADVEATLWAALEASLDSNGKLLILIDGLDQLSGVRIGNPEALATLDRITKSKRHVKAIVLGRPVSTAALKHVQESLTLEDVQDAANDIDYYVQDFIKHSPQLRKLTEAETHDLVLKHKEASRGSILWAELQLQTVKHEHSAAEILKACQNAPKSVDERVDHLIGDLNIKRPETKHILSWVLAAERPLALREIKSLLEVDLERCAYRPFSDDTESTVRQLCGSLVVIRDGLVYLRHPSIRERLVSTTSASNKTSKLVIDLKEAHRELTMRSTAYVKIHLQHVDIDPQADLYDIKHLQEDFSRHHLFEYAARYWIFHFRASTLYDKSGKFNLSPQFSVSFPNSVHLAVVEGTCLARQYIATEAEQLQNLAYKIRKTLFSDQSPAVLQSLILELRIGRKFKGAQALAEYSYDAWKISRHICQAAVVQDLAEAFIEYSHSLSTVQNTGFSTKKEEILQYLIEVYEHNHDTAKHIHYLSVLAGLYVETHQVQKAVVIYRDLYRLRLKSYGHLHEETHSLYDLLLTYLKQLSLYEEVLELTLEYHQYLEQTLAITDERRIQSTLNIVQIYEERKEVLKAEEVLVRYWKSVSETHETSRTTELKIDFGLKYSHFLHRYDRREESEVMLRGLWTEIQSYSYESRFESSMIKRVQKIAESFSSLEVYSMTRSIYQSLYEHYERHEQRTSTESITIVRQLAETITKSLTQSRKRTSSFSSTKSISSSSTTVVTKEEKTLKEVFESSLTSKEISSTTISICQALCSSYMQEERYEEATEIYSRVVSKVWSSIESSSESVNILQVTEHLTEEIFELALNLAYSHFKMLHIEIAETIYLNIFRALIGTRRIENKHFLLSKIKLIIKFFEETYEYDRVVEIYRELYVWMPICFGKTDSETITILIQFARICYRMRLHREAVAACSFIYNVFRIAHGCLHYDGFEAAFLLAQIYELEGKWESAYEVYGYLWRTFVRFGAEYKLDVTIVEKIYKRYMFILEHKEFVKYETLLQVSKEYYESCVKFYKHTHETTVKATLEYASICERREEHHQTSIALYQQVIKYCHETKTEFSKKSLRTCNTNIAKIYSSNTKEISKAVAIYRDSFEQSKKTELTSTETLSALSSLVYTYKKQSTTESITTATQTLRSTTLEIYQHESRSEKLITSARSIASIYKECSFTEQATTLVQEMRSKVIEEARQSVTSSKTEHKSFVFLASFQEAISESSFSSVVAELRSEILMYESYFRSTKTQTDARSIIKSASGLYFHLEKRAERKSEFLSIEKELLGYFSKYLSLTRAVNESVMHYFFRLYLGEASKVHYEHQVVRQATETVLKFTKTAKFAEAYDLVLLIDRFIHLQGGFHDEFYILVGFDLAKYLVGIKTNKCKDEKLYLTMLDLSRAILQEALQGLDKVDVELSDLQQLLADLVRVLSEQKKYQDLERILQTLSQTRTVRNTMSSSPFVLYLGRSLIQTLASLGKFPDAIHLCHDIRYNLAYIRGHLDRTTLEFTTLLSELYTQQKRYRDAMELHEDVLARLGDGQSAPGLDAVDVAARHAELLEMAFKRQGKFDKDPRHYYDVFGALDARFAGKDAWNARRPHLEKWTAGVKDGETRGAWRKPARFEWSFEDEETPVERGWREELVTRRVSGNVWGKRENGAANGGAVHANGGANGKVY